VPMQLPLVEQATEWLRQQGVAEPAVLLAATGGQPQLALEWLQQGVDAALWLRLPALVGQGEASALASWPLPRVIDAMQKLCHDAACVAVEAPPRYFAVGSIAPGVRAAALAAWARELGRVARHDEHAWNAGLMIESLVQQGQRALAAAKPTAKQGVSVHSRT
jgi:DNA polymerase III subunit delta'